MSALGRGGRLEDVDAAYQLLIDAHDGLDDEASCALDARLVLVLANHIGDIDVLREAIAVAHASLPSVYADDETDEQR